jgi:hypothetical protein
MNFAIRSTSNDGINCNPGVGALDDVASTTERNARANDSPVSWSSTKTKSSCLISWRVCRKLLHSRNNSSTSARIYQNRRLKICEMHEATCSDGCLTLLAQSLLRTVIRSVQILRLSWDADANPFTNDLAIVLPTFNDVSLLPNDSTLGSTVSIICILSLQRLMEKSSARSKRRAT